MLSLRRDRVRPSSSNSSIFTTGNDLDFVAVDFLLLSFLMGRSSGFKNIRVDRKKLKLKITKLINCTRYKKTFDVQT